MGIVVVCSIMDCIKQALIISSRFLKNDLLRTVGITFQTDSRMALRPLAVSK